MQYVIKVITQSIPVAWLLKHGASNAKIGFQFQYSNVHFECSQAIVHRTMKEWKLFIFMDDFTFMKVFFSLNLKHTHILMPDPSV